MRLRCIALAALLIEPLVFSARAGSLTVPGDFPRINSAMQAAVAGDTVLVACGTYPEFVIRIRAGIVLKSVSGDPSCVTIDGEDRGTVIFGHFLDENTAIEGITVTGGHPDNHGGGMYFGNSDLRITNCVFEGNQTRNWGGGVAFQGTSSPRIENCVFQGNSALFGGGIYCEAGTPFIVDCIFESNEAGFSGGGITSWSSGSAPKIIDCLFKDNSAGIEFGGGIFASSSSPSITGSTFVGNFAPVLGAGVHAKAGASVELDRCIVAFNHGAQSVFCQGSQIALTCCNLFKNDAGDWPPCVASQRDENGNFSADPLFCDRGARDLSLRSDSPCAPDASACGLIGSSGVGCGAVSVEPISWGELKSRYFEH